MRLFIELPNAILLIRPNANNDTDLFGFFNSSTKKFKLYLEKQNTMMT